MVDVIDVPKPTIEANQILIKAHAYAANPTDWKGLMYFAKPGVFNIVGTDVAGEVVEVGADVKGYQKGDLISSVVQGNYSPSRGAFSQYAATYARNAIKYAGPFAKEPLSPGDHPSTLINSYEAAAASSLGLATAGLSFSHSLHIPYDVEKGTNILIWGGATATGVYAIQVAKLVYGLTVITTASAKNHAFLKLLGADAVFDYTDADVVDQIRAFGKGNIPFVLDTVSNPKTFQACYDATEGTPEVALDNLLYMQLSALKQDPARKARFGLTLVYNIEGYFLNGLKIDVPEPLFTDFDHFWQKVLPPYVSQFRTPALRVLKPGLESANEALALLKGSKVSGEKVVWRYD